ncbi:hypothetical protein [Vibrio alginolyticus]|uniref:hypothetical protein n=1 Tax=Vibrio alginolyticus TaxID=663 RepID=UPI002A745A1A|nr:hypothetical protein [Vibrio parahaemolyticus]EJS9606128.1 hypothetical protein [Vibrio parahaemolyticus]
MFIKITNCSPRNYGDDGDRIDALSHIIKSSGRRKNVVYSDSKTMSDVIDSGLYDINVNRFANEIKDVRRELGDIRRNLDFLVIVDFELESDEITHTLTNDAQYELKCSYKHFISPKTILGTTLLSENLRDCKFYKIVGKKFAQHKLGVNIDIAMEEESGGGSGTYDHYLASKGNREFTLCIIDNDKAHPQKGEGSTSSRFPLKERNNRGQQTLHVLSVREIESIIPDTILEQVITSAVHRNNRITDENGVPLPKYNYPTESIDNLDKIKNIDSETGFEFRKYFDHKDGLNLFKANALDRKYGNFWTPLFKVHHLFSNKPCRPSKVCVNTEEQKVCDCISLKGIGSNILEHSIDYLKANSYSNIKNNMTPPMINEWEDIGQKVLSWGCALSLPKSRV